MRHRPFFIAISIAILSLPGSLLAKTLPTLVSPAPGSTVSGDSETFTWEAMPRAQQYYLYVGDTSDGAIFFAGSTGTSLKQTVKGLPTHGGTFSVRLWTEIADEWSYRDYKYQAAAIPRVLLFLHGVSSPASIWDYSQEQLELGNMPTIKNGVANSVATEDLEGRGLYAYAIAFGAYDVSSGRIGLEGVKGGANYSTNGDFETFANLGTEVDSAVACILKLQPGAQIVLVAHSRGGLAGRAFLQNLTAAHRSAIVGFVTLGTPNQGTRIGRIYAYLGAHPRPGNQPSPVESDNWKIADFIRTTKFSPHHTDIRRPTINDLSDVNSDIAIFNSAAGNLPPKISYYGVAYIDEALGNLAQLSSLPILRDIVYNLFHGFHIPLLIDIPPATPGCVTYTLGNADPASYPGDGLVTAPSAAFLDKPGIFLDKAVLHASEPQQASEISKAVDVVGGGWFN